MREVIYIVTGVVIGFLLGFLVLPLIIIFGL